MSNPNTPRNGQRLTLTLDDREWRRVTRAAGLDTETQQAGAIGVTRVTVSRVRHGHCAPGPDFLAGVATAFPDADLRKLFPVIPKDTAP